MDKNIHKKIKNNNILPLTDSFDKFIFVIFINNLKISLSQQASPFKSTSMIKVERKNILYNPYLSKGSENLIRSSKKYNLIKNISLFLLILFSFHSNAQKKADTLSVFNMLTIAQKENHIERKDSLARIIYFTSIKLKYPRGVYGSLEILKRTKRVKSQADSVLWYCKHAIKNTKSGSFHKSSFYGNIAEYYQDRNVLDSALYYNNLDLNEATTNEGDLQRVDAYISLGNYWLKLQEVNRSFTNYVKADSILEANPKLAKSKRRGIVYNYMGYCARVSSGYEKALIYYLKAKDVYIIIESKDGLSEVNIAIAQAYTNLKQPEKAIPLLDEALKYNRIHGTYNDLGYNIIVRGYTYLKMKNFKKAEKDYLEYYNLAKKGELESQLAQASEYMSDFYGETNQLDKQYLYLKQALKFYKLNARAYKRSTLLLSIIENLEKRQKWEEASKYYKMYLDEQIIKSAEDVKKNTEELEIQYQTVKKEQEIALLKSQNELSNQKQRSKSNLLIGSLGLTLIAGIFLFVLYRNRKKTNNKLRELDSAKSRFFENISHEFRTPLSLIQGPIDDQLEKENLEEQEKINLKIAKKNSTKLLLLVDQILDLSKLQSGQFKLKVEINEIKTFLNGVLSSFSYVAKKNNQHFQYDLKIPDGHFWYDTDVLEKIINNLISNALKFSPKNANITIDAVISNDNFLQFSIRNSGIQLSKDELNRIFARFYSSNEKGLGAGTGIGLALTKDLVELHKGTILAMSSNNEVIIKFALPIYKKAFTNEEISKKSHEIQETSQVNFEAQDFNTAENIENELSYKDNIDPSETVDHPILLIVEDNEELQIYLKSLFDAHYVIKIAPDGIIGFNIAQEKVPDLIITDLMMPNEDGLKFTHKCKTNPITSHIPIIMLTAKTGEEHVLTGLKIGADGYTNLAWR